MNSIYSTVHWDWSIIMRFDTDGSVDSKNLWQASAAIASITRINSGKVGQQISSVYAICPGQISII